MSCGKKSLSESLIRDGHSIDSNGYACRYDCPVCKLESQKTEEKWESLKAKKELLPKYLFVAMCKVQEDVLTGIGESKESAILILKEQMMFFKTIPEIDVFRYEFDREIEDDSH